MEGFSRKEGGVRKLLAKEKKELFQERSPSFTEKGRGSYLAGLIFLWGIVKAHVTDYLSVPDQKIPD